MVRSPPNERSHQPVLFNTRHCLLPPLGLTPSLSKNWLCSWTKPVLVTAPRPSVTWHRSALTGQVITSLSHSSFLLQGRAFPLSCECLQNSIFKSWYCPLCSVQTFCPAPPLHSLYYSLNILLQKKNNLLHRKQKAVSQFKSNSTSQRLRVTKLSAAPAKT